MYERALEQREENFNAELEPQVKRWTPEEIRKHYSMAHVEKLLETANRNLQAIEGARRWEVFAL